MYVDKQCTLDSERVVETTNGASVYSEFAYDMGSTKDPGGGGVLYIVVCVDDAFASASSDATVVIAVVDDANNGIDSSSIPIVQTDALVVTRLPLGKVIVIPVPYGLITQQFIGMKYTVGVDTTTAGQFTTFIALDALTNPGS